MNKYQEYFYWLIEKVEYVDGYLNLLNHLYNTPFDSDNPMDANRVSDVDSLRNLYFKKPEIVAGMKKNQPVSVLEVLISLAGRMNRVVEDDEDKTPTFFWTMINNMGLGSQNNDSFDPDYVNMRVDILVRRQYEKDGSGGALFTIGDPNHDMRDADLWYQAMWYLAEDI